MNRILLTIAIPTFNRPKELKGNLEVCLQEYKSLGKSERERVKFFISDNASTNYDLEMLLQEYKDLMPLTYDIKSKNIGPTKNFEYCYRSLDTEYLLLLSDDDYFTKNSLKFIINLIKVQEPGIVFLNSYDNYYPSSNDVEIISDKNLFVRRLDILPTLISSIIFNKKILDQIEPSFLNTNLHQLYYYLYSVILADKLILVNKKVLFSQYDNNSGGYNWFNTFCNELYDIVDFILEMNVLRKEVLVDIKKNTLKQRLIPTFLNYKIDKEKFNKFNNSDSNREIFKLIYERNKNYAYTWLLLIPIYLLPKSFLILLKKLYMYIKLFGKFNA